MSLLSAENVGKLLTEMPDTMANFPPLGLILVVMLGAAVAERSGLFTTLMNRAMRGVPNRFLSPAIFLIGLPQGISAVKDFLPDAIGQAPGLKSVIYGAVLIAFVMFEPMGLYGRWLKIRTYLQLFPFYRKGMFKRQKSFQKSDRLK